MDKALVSSTITPRRSTWIQRGPGRSFADITVYSSLLLVLALSFGSQPLRAQSSKNATPQKLPSAEKIVEGYFKAVGGKRRLAPIRDATYEWTIHLSGQPIGTAKTQVKSPASLRSEMTFGNGQIISGANPASAWVWGLDKRLLTLTGPDAASAKLQALLTASHVIDYKKLNVMPRVIALGDLSSQPAYIVEFSTRAGARLRYWFSLQSNLLVMVEDEARKTTTRFGDYKSTTGQLPLEPHLVQLKTGDGELTFRLQRATYNTNIPNSLFDPPRSEEALDVVSLLREVARNQETVQKRISEYAFFQKETDREINGKGELKKEKTRVYEVFPVSHHAPIRKLISENGVVLGGERAAKEAQRVDEELVKVEREREKTEEKVARRKAARMKQQSGNGGAEPDEDPTISQFLKVCEFVSPRRERFNDREAIVFDFRPRPGFKPGNRSESLIAKLVGVAWIDPVDKQVMRLEAKLAEGFKMAGGLVLSLRPGAGFVMEQTRMAEGIWLPRFAHVNLSVKVFLFRGIDVNKTIEWSDYKHFKGDVNDYKLDAPQAELPEKPR